MGIIKNTYAFDDSSILKLCAIIIPNSFKVFFQKKELTARNYPKLKLLIDKLAMQGIPKFRFVPAKNIDENIIKAANQILEGYNIQMLRTVFKVDVIDQLTGFNDQIRKEFLEIIKDEKIDGIKQTFENNLRELSKEDNTPQDDDLKIIIGYYRYECDGNKYLITEDEHFWGYSDLIIKNFNIYVVKEWECHTLNI